MRYDGHAAIGRQCQQVRPKIRHERDRHDDDGAKFTRRELSKRATGNTLYILDEPSTGLHAVDVKRLIDVVQMLVDNGNSIVVIEHNLDIIKVADHIIDLGPEGGDGGGEIIAQGTPEEVAENPNSYTGQYLRHMLEYGQAVLTP